MAARPPLVLLLLAATAGLLFASVSTFDFAQHLDRQVHDLHCSFVPGLAAAGSGDSTGCQVTLMSPYSSVLRQSIWGGLPISLPAMAVFAFLLFRGVDMLGRKGSERKAGAVFLALVATVPMLATVVMGSIAYFELEAACKLCIGIYFASTAGFVAALWHLAAVKKEARETEDLPTAKLVVPGGLQFLAFVALPVLAWVAVLPDYAKFLGTCGKLNKADDPYGVMVPLGKQDSGISAIEVFDPLCPACRGFEERLATSGLAEKLRRKAVLFPLDEQCNWMVTSSLHPGACAVSEAVLCANKDGKVAVKEVIDWAFQQQEAIREAAKADPGNAQKRVLERFPALQGCMGSPEIQAQMNKSLRWAVQNELPVLTPQLYLDGHKVCDEDTDLGLDYALSHMIELQQAGKLGSSKEAP